MTTFKIHIKGSNTPTLVTGDSAKYTKDFLVIKTSGRTTAMYPFAEIQGWSEVSDSVESGPRKETSRTMPKKSVVVAPQRKTQEHASIQ